MYVCNRILYHLKPKKKKKRYEMGIKIEMKG